MYKIDEIKIHAHRHHVPIMKDGGIEFLTNFLSSHPQIQRILEIGTAVGYSSIKMAQIRENISIDTVELSQEMFEKANENIRSCQLQDRIYTHLCDGLEYNTLTVYDLIFIDAAKAQYRKYMERYLKNAHQDTVFVFDNLSFHGIVENPSLSKNRSTIQMVRKIKRFKDWLAQNEAFDVIFYDSIGDGIAVVTQKSKIE